MPRSTETVSKDAWPSSVLLEETLIIDLIIKLWP